MLMALHYNSTNIMDVAQRDQESAQDARLELGLFSVATSRGVRSLVDSVSAIHRIQVLRSLNRVTHHSDSPLHRRCSACQFIVSPSVAPCTSLLSLADRQMAMVPAKKKIDAYPNPQPDPQPVPRLH